MSDSTSYPRASLAGMPPELLAQIVSCLPRPHPDVYSQASWKDYHQQDLTSVALVNHRLNDFIPPILYDSACVDDIEKFFSGLGDDTPSHARRLYLLSHVRRLHLIDRHVSNDMATSEPEGSENTELRRYLSSVVSTWHSVLSVSKSGANILPKIEALTIGEGENAKAVETDWRGVRHDSLSRNAELLREAELLSGQVYQQLKPPRLYLLDTEGPFSVPTYDEDEPLPTTTLVTSYMPYNRIHFTVGIVPGAENRILRVPGGGRYGGRRWCLDHWGLALWLSNGASFDTERAQQNPRTRIKVYGLSHPGTARLVRADDDSVHFAPLHSPVPAHDVGLAAAYEMQEMTVLQSRGFCPPGWEGRFEMFLRSEAPPGEYDGDNA